MALVSLLDKTLALERDTPTLDAVGGRDAHFAAVSGMSNIPCSVAPISAAIRREFDRDDTVLECEVYTATDIGAQERDRLVIGGKNFNVIGYKPFENSNFGESVYVTVCGRRNQ